MLLEDLSSNLEKGSCISIEKAAVEVVDNNSLGSKLKQLPKLVESPPPPFAGERDSREHCRPAGLAGLNWRDQELHLEEICCATVTRFT